MSVQITTAFVEQYKSNVFHLAQQKGSRLRDAVRSETVTGKSHFFERIGSVAAGAGGRGGAAVGAETGEGANRPVLLRPPK